eukprot:2692-Heterococcus_DN1.PRE.3
MAVQHPAVMCALLRREFDRLLTVVLPTVASSGAAVIDAQGQLTKSSPVFRHFAAFATPLENCTERVPESAWQQQQAQFIQGQPETPSPLVSMTALVEQAIAWTSQPQQQAVIVSVQLKHTAAVITLIAASSVYTVSRALKQHFLRYSTQHLLPVLEVCFSRLRFSTDAAVAQQPLEQQLDNLDPEVLTVRRSASHTCVNIAKALPDVLVQIFQQLCVSVKAQCDQGQLLDSQQQHLYEMLVIVSNAVPDVATRRAFVMDMCNGTLQQWNSDAVNEMLASPQALLQALQVGAEAGPTNAATVKQGWKNYELLV